MKRPVVLSALACLAFSLSSCSTDVASPATPNIEAQGLNWAKKYAQKHAPRFWLAKTNDRASCAPGKAATKKNGKWQKSGSADLKAWPTVGQGGCEPAENPDMATYVTIERCGPKTLQIGYWLWFPKDGYAAGGHVYDWEGAVVELKKAGSGNWQPRTVYGTAHGYAHKGKWSKIEKTGNNNRPVLYIGWSQHAMHFDTGGSGLAGQAFGAPFGANNDYRSQHAAIWSKNSLRYIKDMPRQERKIIGGDWGKATPPMNKAPRVCRNSGNPLEINAKHSKL